MSSEVVSRASAFRGGPIIASADEHLWANINRRPFVFRHTLGNNPLLELPRLAELAVRAAHRNQRGHFFSRKGPGEDLSLADRIRQLDEREDWIKISYANELDPDYAEIHDALLDELAALSQIPIRESMSWSGMTIFMNSPNLAVPYHFDHETNFLMQVRGTKTVDLFDQTDRSVLTEAEIESFYRGDVMAGRYRPDLENRASTFVLNAGDAVHHPPLAPHRIFNHDRVSISVSIFFTLPQADQRAHVYQVNSFMRQLRLKPNPPGRSIHSDRWKVGLMRAISQRNPRSQKQAIFSGVQRVRLPARIVRKLVNTLARKSS